MSSFLYTVKAFFVLDTNKGERVIAKYYDPEFESQKKQREFEKNVFEKTNKVNAGDYDQNELALLNVLNTFTETLNSLFDNQIDKKTLIDGINYTLLALDEIIDEGIVLENDASIIRDRVGIKMGDNDDLDENISKILNSAKDQLAAFLK
eukprot:gene5572-6938_t